MSAREFDAFRPRPPLPDENSADLARLEYEWLQEGTESFASDFVGSALLVGKTELARGAAEFLATEGSTERLRRLGAVAIGYRGTRLPLGQSEASLGLPPVRREISRLKKAVARDPRNALAWAELARLYASRGQHAQAERALRIALQAAPDNRFLLRSAACFYVQRDPRQGHDLLLSASSLVRDPWLLAAELALSNVAGREPRHMKVARAVLDDAGFAPIHLTELASQVATFELRSGSDKKARRHFATALEDPNDNSVAQVEWASHRMSGLHVGQSLLAIPLAAEARSRHAMEKGRWKAATEEARLWLNDQPFSDDAAMHASYLASVGLQDWQLSAEFAERGLRANPASPMLRNNLAYALLEKGRIDEARESLALIRTSEAQPGEEVAILATRGLLCFRTGDLSAGRAYYERSMAQARSLKSPTHRAMAAVMLAREELIAGSEEAVRAVRQAERLSRGETSKALMKWLSQVVEAAKGVRSP